MIEQTDYPSKENSLYEPFRIKMVEPIKTTTRSQRAELLKEAKNNIFLIKAEDVLNAAESLN